MSECWEDQGLNTFRLDNGAVINEMNDRKIFLLKNPLYYVFPF